ncbi:protein kinase domain-containing protein [Actinoallomurus sp. CA-150999]|uniref:serine/threonine-protein kinase n=1 Tax=Actinoallomurus sp. CA-150999 TaxID=3239887 RepID=UPI003D9367A3
MRPEDPREIGSYRLLGRLGGGGMGQVFLGRSPGGRPVAVKVLLPGLAADDGFRRRFDQEIEAARRVGGFHTAPVVDADPTAAPPWLVTAYIPGPSLREAVEAYGALPRRAVLALGAGLAEGLAAIHACGLVHRDLKPGNIILAADGPRIIDFGIARAMDAARITAAGAALGTPGFMSPEQIHGDGDLGPACDVFALGSVLTFAATGRGPFDGGSAASTGYRVLHAEPDLDAVPPPVRDLVVACLAKDPAARPAVADVLRELSPSVDTSSNWLPPAVAAMIAERNASIGADAPPPAEPGTRPLDEPPAAPAAEILPPAPSEPSTARPEAFAPGTIEWTPDHGVGGWEAPGLPGAAPWQEHPPLSGPPPAYPPLSTQPTWPVETQSRPSGGAGAKRAVVVVGSALALLAVAGIVAFAATRGTKDSGDPGGTPKGVSGSGAAGPSTPGNPTTPPGAAGTAAVVGTWQGTYTCAQGLTNLQLVIGPSTTDGGVEATFNFSANPSNPSVPSGSYTMQGTFVSRHLELRGERWINRPGAYEMVGLSADVPEDRPSRISGSVVADTGGCTSFSVNRK